MFFLALACQRALTPVPALMPQPTVTPLPTSARARAPTASLASQRNVNVNLVGL